jgi:hypothetical protein
MRGNFLRFLILALVCLQASCNSPDNWPRDRFDAKRWHSVKEDERYPMVYDLINRRILIGLTTSEMQQLLGAPSSWGLQRLYCTYVVKQEPTGWDHVFILHIDIDPKNDRVISARVRSD